MAFSGSLLSRPSPIPLRRRVGTFCCSPDDKSKSQDTPALLRIAVGGATELLRLVTRKRVARTGNPRKDEVVVRSVDDVVSFLRSDYANAYFLTGNFTPELYTDDCLFEDPTIRFRGKDLYARNLELLVPFFVCPSLELKEIKKGAYHGTEFVLAVWTLRTCLRLPWRPCILIDGSTVYDLNSKFQIVRHAESWNVSALQAVGQIFTPPRKEDDA